MLFLATSFSAQEFFFFREKSLCHFHDTHNPLSTFSGVAQLHFFGTMPNVVANIMIPACRLLSTKPGSRATSQPIFTLPPPRKKFFAESPPDLNDYRQSRWLRHYFSRTLRRSFLRGRK